MSGTRYHIIAPQATGEAFNEAEVFGGIVWLWMHSKMHQNAPLCVLTSLLLPTIKCRQFILVSEQGKPVFYASWANLSLEAEKRYLTSLPACMLPADWTSGNRTWILDWIAPFGHTQAMRHLLLTRLFYGKHLRWLYHRGEEKGPRIMSGHGIAITPEEHLFWLEQTPPAHSFSSEAIK